MGGNSLSDLAYYIYCHDTKHQLLETLHGIVRGFLYSKLPAGFILEHPTSMIGRRGVSLSQVYERAVQVGIMNKHRAINDRIRMQHFEQQSGMLQKTSNRGKIAFSRVILWGALAAAVAYGYQYIC